MNLAVGVGYCSNLRGVTISCVNCSFHFEDLERAMAEDTIQNILALVFRE